MAEGHTSQVTRVNIGQYHLVWVPKYRFRILTDEISEEATQHLSEEFKASYPEIEWYKIAGLRVGNVALVTHFYGRMSETLT